MASEAVEVERSELSGPPELAARFDHVRALPFGERPLAFTLLVPKPYGAVTDMGRPAAGPGEFVKIGSFRAPAREGGAAGGDSIDVAIVRLGRDVGLVDFLAYLRERYALEVLSVDPLDYGGREAVDALTRWTAGSGPPRVSRFVLFRNADALVRVAGTAFAERYNEVAETFAVSLSTFRFLEERPDAFTEPYGWASSVGAIPLGFRRPLSWKLEERRDVPWGREVLDLRYVERGDLAAFLRAKAIDRDVAGELDLDSPHDIAAPSSPMTSPPLRGGSPASGGYPLPPDGERPGRLVPSPQWGKALDSLAAETLEELRTVGFVSAVLRQRSSPPSPGRPFEQGTLALIYEGRAFGQPAEARLCCLGSARALYAVAAILPGKDADRIGWMAAKRAFEVACQTLNRPEEDLLRPPSARPPPAAPAAEPAPPEPEPPSPWDDVLYGYEDEEEEE